MSDKLTTLRRFFATTNAVFTLQKTISGIFNNRLVELEMHTLHKLALRELIKEEPDMNYIEKLLNEIELEADRNKKESSK